MILLWLRLGTISLSLGAAVMQFPCGHCRDEVGRGEASLRTTAFKKSESHNDLLQSLLQTDKGTIPAQSQNDIIEVYTCYFVHVAERIRRELTEQAIGIRTAYYW